MQDKYTKYKIKSKHGILTLPRKELSFSSISLWNTSQTQFRDKYYEGIKFGENKYTLFGREIHELIGRNKKFKDIQIGEQEKKIIVKLEGIPLVGYIDTFNKLFKRGEYAFGEYKTGKNEWTQTKADTNKQVKSYSLLITLLTKRKANKAFIVWLETESTPDIKIGSVTLKHNTMRLTGHRKKYEIKINNLDRELIKQWIINSAIAISEDYQNYLKKLSTGMPF